MSEIEVVYFPFKGRAEKIRLLLADVGADWKNVHIDGEAFGKLKASGELQWGSVPAVRCDGTTLVQTGASMAYLGRKFGVYPTDAKACYTVDSLAGGIEDFIGKFIKAHPNFGGSKEAMQEMVDNESGRWIGALSKVLEDAGTPYVGGEEPNVGDYHLADIVMTCQEALPGVIEKYPLLTQFVERFKARPNIAAYLKSDKCPPPNEPVI